MIVERTLAAFARWGARRPGRVLVLSLLACALGLVGVASLKVDQDLKALLPGDCPSVERLEQAAARLGAQNDLIIEIRSPDRAANLAYAGKVAEALRGFPEIRWVAFHRPLDLFRQKGLLFVPLPDLLDLRREVMGAIRRETERRLDPGLDDGAGAEAATGEASPGLLPDKDGRADDVHARLRERLGLDEVPTEHLEADDGRIVVVRARPTEGTTETDFAGPLVRKTEAMLAGLLPAAHHPQMTARVRGDYVSAAGRGERLRSDVLATAAFALGLLFAVIAGYFRRLRAVPIVVLPVVASTLVTLGLGAAIEGTFNIVTTFIFAVLLGLGTDFGIHCLARYGFERERGADVAEALERAMTSTGAALLAGAGTTALVFFALHVGRFRGFSQFGLVAGIGVLAALLATYLVFPALVAAIHRVAPWSSPRFASRRTGAEPPSRGGGAGAAWAVVLTAVLLTVASLAALPAVGFEYDFSKLGPASADKARPPGKDFRDAVGRVTTYSPAVALCETEQDCEQLTRLFEAMMTLKDPGEPFADPAPAGRGDGRGGAAEDDADDDADDDAAWGDEDDPIAALEAQFKGGRRLTDAQRALLRPLGRERLERMREATRAFISLQTFLPPGQDDRLKVIADLREQVDRKRGALTGEVARDVDRWRPLLDVDAPVTEADLPGWILQEVTEKDGARGRFLVIWNAGSKSNYVISESLKRDFFDLPLPGVGGVAARSVPVAANYFVLVDVVDSLREDGPRVLGLACALVFACLAAMFRSVRKAALTLVPLAASVTWLSGLHVLAGWKLNMFSIVAFPLLIGIGIDNGIHIHHRWIECRDLRTVMREVGGPITLCVVTTLIGFGGLTLAGHRGIASLGRTAALGLLLAYVGSVVLLPAILSLLDRRRPAAPPGAA